MRKRESVTRLEMMNFSPDGYSTKKKSGTVTFLN